MNVRSMPILQYPSTETSFKSLSAARAALINIAAMQLVGLQNRPGAISTAWLDGSIRQAEVGECIDITEAQVAGLRNKHECTATAHRLDRWNKAFDDYLQERRTLPFNAAEKRIVALIEFHKRYLQLSIAAARALRTLGYVDWDSHVGDYDEMVSFASKASDFGATLAVPRFHTDLGVVPILFVIVARCRDPCIRRRAIRIMTSNPVQEGVWNSRHMVRIAQSILNTEEDALIVKSCKDIPEYRRVQRVYLWSKPWEPRSTVRYVLASEHWEEQLTW